MWCPGEEAGVVMREPEEIDAQEHDEILARVAAIDVATATGMVCSRIPDDRRPAKRTTKVWEVSATTNAIIELGDHLRGLSIERVVVESTSDYWRPFVYLLEACGLRVWLVNAHDVKNVPGRPKTDKLDAVWLAKLGRAGHAAPVVRAPARDP
jgi:transposase